MTRKQAISTVLGYLERQPELSQELCKAILILKEMQNGMPGKIWSDETIRAAVERFMDVKGRPPKVTELDAVEYLPPHPVVARQYGMTAGKWLEENYPGPKGGLPGRYKGLTPGDLREMFIQSTSVFNLQARRILTRGGGEVYLVGIIWQSSCGSAGGMS